MCFRNLDFQLERMCTVMGDKPGGGCGPEVESSDSATSLASCKYLCKVFLLTLTVIFDSFFVPFVHRIMVLFFTDCVLLKYFRHIKR